jgi:hypothetical protein
MFEPYSYVLNENNSNHDSTYYNYNDLQKNVDSYLIKFRKEYDR